MFQQNGKDGLLDVQVYPDEQILHVKVKVGNLFVGLHELGKQQVMMQKAGSGSARQNNS